MKWDYRVQDISAKEAEAKLKEFGQQEWEVFGAQSLGNAGDILRIFMRKPLGDGTTLIGKE
jgi:hypothetical protein